MKKILVVCETIDFQNFTRRATIEALAQQDGVYVEALMNANIRLMPKVNKQSKFLQVRCLFYFFIQRFSGTILASIEKIVLKMFWGTYFKKFDYVMFTQPNQEYLISLFPSQKKLFLISDPYHLMGLSEDLSILSAVKNMYQNVDTVLVTAQNLGKTYIPKYVDAKDIKRVVYWPNTVDTTIWDYDKLVNSYMMNARENTIGFIGNFMNVTDINLLDFISQTNPSLTFIIAGRITNSLENDERVLLNKIFDRENVTYLGLLPYNKVPELVMSFTIGILLDKKTELASYHHHNKLYQYLALGKPVVTLDYLNDYSTLESGVFVASTYEEYNQSIQAAINEAQIDSAKKMIIQTAKTNNSLKRAEQLMSLINEMN